MEAFLLSAGVVTGILSLIGLWGIYFIGKEMGWGRFFAGLDPITFVGVIILLPFLGLAVLWSALMGRAKEYLSEVSEKHEDSHKDKN